MPVCERQLNPNVLLSLFEVFGYGAASQLPVKGHTCSASWLLLDPDAGPLLYFFLYSWLYAFYWHDYKWSLTNSPVRSRLDLFESHWAFFAGGPAFPPVFISTAHLHAGFTGFQCCCRLWQHLHHPSMVFLISAQRGHHGHAVSFVCPGCL